jgi:hypothetical protein
MEGYKRSEKIERFIVAPSVERQVLSARARRLANNAAFPAGTDDVTVARSGSTIPVASSAHPLRRVPSL